MGQSYKCESLRRARLLTVLVRPYVYKSHGRQVGKGFKMGLFGLFGSGGRDGSLLHHKAQVISGRNHQKILQASWAATYNT